MRQRFSVDVGITGRWRLVAATVVLLSALLVLAVLQRSSADAASPGCTPACVILIQVDGLEPKDVTPQSTPYLWLLAHPPQVPGGGGGAALSNRSGWIWQAPRGAVSTGTGSATATLLTGAYPEFSGVPSDDFFRAKGGDFGHQRLGAGGLGDADPDEAAPQSRDGAGPLEAPPVTTLVEAVHSNGGKAAVFLGDPALAKVAHANSGETAAFWYPPGNSATSASTPDPQFTGNLLLCPIPRYPNDSAPTPGAPDPSWCAADDRTTANKAARDLTAKPDVGFTFLHLAELGVAKRWAGNPSVDADVPQPSEALTHADDAIATFLEQYAESSPTKWQDTVVMVVGSHGYQLTPLVDRVPDPANPTGVSGSETRDLSDFVAGFWPGSALKLVPQGTMATIYYRPEANPATISSTDRADALAAIKEELESTDSDSVNSACALLNAALGPCIKEVLYVDPNTPGTEDTVQRRHPSWRLDVRDPDSGVRTGAGGDLVVVFTRGWASGRAVGLPETGAGTEAQPISNPYTASSGGPQERAVAALVNGPRQFGIPGAVRNLGDGVRYYPVSRQTVDPSDPSNPPPTDDASCPDVPTSLDLGGLACANRPGEVGDDADDPGHEAQPITVDFAVTVSALMQLPFDSFPRQLQGRVLQEAFLSQLATPCVEECDPVPPDPEPEPPPLPPPPPPEVVLPPEFDFYGLMRGLKAVVVDARNRTYARAKRGSKLSAIRLEGDFGKPETAVTLTFYRRAPKTRRTARGSRTVRLKPIARFDPFVVKRGHVTMRLKIPRQFKPTYIGMTVREIAHSPNGTRRLSGGQPCTTQKTRKPVRFRCTGPTRGAIVRIADAGRLHKTKKAVATKPRPRSRR